MLVVVAHPDDETYGCGSLLAHAAARGATTIVACATRGEEGECRPGTVPEGGDLAVVREAELRAAAAYLGVSRVELFSWCDSGLVGEPTPKSFVAAPLADVAARVAALIDDVEPTVVVTIDGSDGHRDHAHIRDATLAALDEASWVTPRAYVQGLPRALMRKWVELLRAELPESAYLGLGELGTPDDAITTVVDTSEFFERREHAITLHATQVSPFDRMPPDVRREFLTRELLCRVRPPWTDGPPETDIFG
jgi:LmbE family N-acetylglucosaminyl deacetylase